MQEGKITDFWKAIGTAGALLIVMIIGWIDHLTGPDISFSIFFLAPVLAAAFWFGRTPGVAVAVAASAVSFWADETLHPPGYIAISVWNGVSWLLISVMLALLITKVRQKLDMESVLARTDTVTGLANSRAFLEILSTELARASRDGHVVTVVYIDIDNFKRVNDMWGHQTGDNLLRQLAGVLRSTIRAGDVPARVGGDEFSVMLSSVGSDAAVEICKRFQEKVKEASKEYPGSDLGASIGIATAIKGAEADAGALIGHADKAMYRAKIQGKGQVVLSESPAKCEP